MVLVGKGITFDTGGLSIKPAEAMATMKRDMTGGAVVLADHGRARARSAARCGWSAWWPAPRTPSAATRLRPGDVVRHYGGRTTEVTNTDAEGRLVLADALAYAVAEIEPGASVDVATLTGAVKVALGQQVGGLFANDDALAAACSARPTAAGEPLWRLPLARRLRGEAGLDGRRRRQRRRGPGRDHRRAVPAALRRRRCPGRTSTSPRSATRPRSATSGRPGPPASVPGPCCTWLGGPDPLAGVRPLSRPAGRTRGARTPSRPQASGTQSFLAPAGRRRRAAAPARGSSCSATARTSSRIATVSSSRWAGSATRSCHRALSKATTPPGRSRRSASLEVGGVLALVAVDEDQVVVAVGQPGQHVERGAGDGARALGRRRRPR